MNISGNYNTAARECSIVARLFNIYNIPYKSISKYNKNESDGDVLVILPDGKDILIEVKEEKYDRFRRFGDLGIDFISAFQFKNPNDVYFWKGPPKSHDKLNSFLSSIDIKKCGKLSYSKSDLWLFFVCDKDDNICYHAFFDGNKMTSDEFYDYLSNNCSFAVNNKPSWQSSYNDSHQSACFFINHRKEILKQYEVNLTDYVKKA